jgi:hypothetical protein
MINLYFGKPCDDWAITTSIEIAIEEDVSVEKAAVIMLERLLINLSRRDNPESYLDSIFGDFFGRIVYAPRISVGQYEQSSILYPMINISFSHVIHRMTGDYWPIKDEAINYLGKRIEDTFGLEFIKYDWVGRQKWLNLKQVELPLHLE